MYKAAAEEETATVESLTSKSRMDESLAEVGTLQSLSASEWKSTQRGSVLVEDNQQMLFEQKLEQVHMRKNNNSSYRRSQSSLRSIESAQMLD